MAFPILGNPKPTFLDGSGNPLVSGTLSVLNPADDTNKASYPTADDADAATSANVNPVVLNSRGEPPNGLFGEDGETYKLVLKDSTGITIWTVDDIGLSPATEGIYNQGGSGATDRTIGARLKDSISVKDFGAAGDGTTNDSVALQNWLNEGGALFLPEGTYIATGLELTANRAYIFGPGILKKQANVDGVLLLVSGDFNLIEGLHFDGTNAAPTPGASNNILNISGDYNRVTSCEVNESKGAGIRIGTPGKGNVVAYCRVYNTRDNNISVLGSEANENIIIGNYCDTTTVQNNIFVTASPDSTVTVNNCYRNQIIGNICLNSADTGIESGINANGTIISGNNVRNSAQPEILLRDNKNCVVTGNHCEAGASAAANHDTISVQNQHESDWDYHAVISANRVWGKILRGGITLGSTARSVLIEGNSIEETNATVNDTTGAGIVAGGIVLQSTSMDVTIRDNVIRRVGEGIDLNWGAGSPTHTRLTVSGNRVHQCDAGINLFQCTLTDSHILDNIISSPVLRGLMTNSSLGSSNSVIDGNIVNLAGFSGASPDEVSSPDLVVKNFLRKRGVAQTEQTLTGAGAILPGYRFVELVTNGINAITLANGTEGHEMCIVMRTDGGVGTLTPASFGNGTNLVFDDVGDSAHLIFQNAAWHFMGGTATLS